MGLRIVHRALDTLPDELLLRILTFCQPEAERNIPSRFSTLHGASQVNKHFRNLALSILTNEQSFLSREEFRQALVQHYSTVSGQAEASRIRKLTIYNTRDCQDRELVTEGQVLPFPNLTTFHCFASFCDHHIPSGLRQSRSLESLALSTCDEPDFPDLSVFDTLKTLRLYVNDLPHLMGVSRPHSLCPEIPSHTLTTLVLSLCPLNPRTDDWLDGQISRLVFPKLRVTRLEGLPAGSSRIYYNFIRRHPTLREAALDFFVSVGNPARLPHLHGLIELIQGRWAPSNVRTDRFASTVDPTVQSVATENVNPEDQARLITFSAFAFSRTPIATDAYRPSYAKPEHMFSATALAVDMIRANNLEEKDWHGRLPYLLKVISREFAEVEELRVSTRDLYDSPHRDAVHSFDNEMTQMAAVLRHYTHLRKFAFQWIVHGQDWRWNANDHPGNLVGDYLKTANGLVCLRNAQPVPSTPAELIASEYFINDEWPNTKQALQEILDEEIDEDDPTVLIRGWRARNERFVSQGMRLLAEACPMLEEIEWHIPRYWGNGATLWVWSIYRDAEGGVRLVNPKDFWYTGSPMDSAYRMDIFVGQELEYERAERLRLGSSYMLSENYRVRV